MDILKKAELTAPIHHIARFLKIRNTDLQFEVSDRFDRKNKKKDKNTDNCKAFCVSRQRIKEYNSDVLRVSHILKKCIALLKILDIYLYEINAYDYTFPSVCKVPIVSKHL